MSALSPRSSRPLVSDRRGFTLIELMIVMVVLGILTTIGGAQYLRMQKNAKRAACVSTQRNLMVMGTLYGAEQGVGTVQIDVEDLRDAGYANAAFGECPDSHVRDFDDYTVDLVDGIVVDCTCTVRGEEHPFVPGSS